MQVISTYALQTNCLANEKDEFWETLETYLQLIRPEEHLAIGGNLNGHIGVERDRYEQFHGGLGSGMCNNDGDWVLDCVEAHDLTITNTFFRKKLMHLITYSSGGQTFQINYWLIQQHNLKLVTDAKVIPSTNIMPQHHLLIMDICLNLSQQQWPQRTAVKKIKWWWLPECKSQLVDAIGALDVNLNQPMARVWSDLVGQIHRAATDVLGKTKPGCQFINKQIWWWDKEVQQTIKEKKVAFKMWLQTHKAEDFQ